MAIDSLSIHMSAGRFERGPVRAPNQNHPLPWRTERCGTRFVAADLGTTRKTPRGSWGKERRTHGWQTALGDTGDDTFAQCSVADTFPVATGW